MEVFIKVVERFNLQRKVMSITSDNGSNVLKLTKDFETFTEKHPNEWLVPSTLFTKSDLNKV